MPSEQLLEDDRFDMLGYGWDEAGKETKSHRIVFKSGD